MSKSAQFPGLSQMGGSPATSKAELEKLCEILEAVKTPIGIESSFAEVGCIKDGGEITGKVFACKVQPEDGSSTTFKYWAFIPGLEPIEDYAGPWEFCVDVCPPATARGVITTW
jgi:hypothetical protein